MAHRALVFYERTDGHYDIHYSQWGGEAFRLQTAITERTPYGGRRTDADRGWLRMIVDALDLDIADAPTDPSEPLVDPDPIGTTPSLAAYVEQFDFGQYEACYVVSTEYAVRTFLPLWFGVLLEGSVTDIFPTVGNGALVAFDPATEADWLRGWDDACSAVIVELLRTGRLDPTTVPSVYAMAIQSHLGAERTIHVAVGTVCDGAVDDSDSG